MLFRSLLLSALFITSAPAAFASPEFLDPADFGERIRREIAKLHVKADMRLFDIDLVDGLKLSAHYALESEPSYVGSYYTRFDRYRLEADLNAGELLEDLDLPFNFRVRKDAEVIFARQFRNQQRSLQALPYSLTRLPLTAERAVKRLNPGDFVAFESELDLIVGVGTSSLTNGTLQIGAGVSTHALVSGTFLIHVFRMPDNKVRVRLIASRGMGLGAGARVDYRSNLTIVGMKAVDRTLNRRATRWLDFRPFSANIEKRVTDLFSLDYVFDLDNSTAANAYDDFMSSRKKFNNAFLEPNPFVTREQLERKLLIDVSAVEKIAAEDAHLPDAQKRIDRIFRGNNVSNQFTRGVRFGLGIVRYAGQAVSSHNRIISYDDHNHPQYFLADNFQQTNVHRYMFGFYGDDTQNAIDVLLAADSSFNPQRFVAYVAASEMKMKDLHYWEWREIKERAARVLPREEYNKIDWKERNFLKGPLQNAFFRQEIFFHPAALASLPMGDAKTAREEFRRYVKSQGHRFPRQQVGNPNRRSATGREEDQGTTSIGQQLAIAFSRGSGMQARHRALGKLKESHLWQRYGADFLVSKIPDGQSARLLSYEFKFSARKAEDVAFRFGNFQQKDLYNSLRFIQRALFDRSFDLRLYTDDQGNVRFDRVPNT